MGVKITDLVDQSAIDGIRNLHNELGELVDKYTDVARNLAKGIEVPIKNLEDLDKACELYNKSSRESVAISTQYNQVVEKQKAIIAETTNVVSRRLMEQERMNKATRDEYAESQKVRELLAQVNGTYEDNVANLRRITKEIKNNKEQQADLEKQYKAGKVSADLYDQTMQNLIITERQLKQEKQTTQTLLKNEEREMQSVETSYTHMSQQLELLKKAYKSLAQDERGSELGKELESTIQNLDAHLKDLAADMGEFQRNVGNYAIAGQNGVVATDSLVAVLQQEALTTKDLADQNKILTEAKSMLNQEDANYAATLEQINAKIAENERRLSDVSDIMDKQATTVAEAEAQNQRLTAALKQVDLTSADASEQAAALNAKIAENNAIINENINQQASVKKNLKEMVLEIATLSLEYQNLTAEEQASADGQALKAHIEDLIERAGALKDAISDTNEAISNAASDTRGIDQVAGSLQLAIDGFGLATGGAEMLGISSGTLAEIQTKLQAAIAASNAVQSIQNTLQKQSAVMQAASLMQTKLRTVAENLHTAAQGKGVVATKLLTVAQWAFNAAATANPIGIIVVAIAACIAAVYGLIKAFTAFFGNSEQAKKEYEDQKKAVDDLAEAHERQIDAMKAKGASEAEIHNQSLLNKQEEVEATNKMFELAKEAYDDDEDEYIEAVEAKKKSEEDWTQFKEDALNYLNGVIHEYEEKEKETRLGTYEYKRQLIQAELEQQKALAKTLLEQEKISYVTYQNMLKSLDAAAQMKIKEVDKKEQEDKSRQNRRSGAGGANAAKKQADELKKAVKAGEDALLNIIQDSIERELKAEDLKYKRQLKELQSALSKTKDNQIKLREALHNQIEGLEAEHKNRLLKIEDSQIDRYKAAQLRLIDSRLAIEEEGSAEILDLRLKKLQVQNSQELDAIIRAERDGTITKEQGLELRMNLVEKYGKLETEAVEGFANERIEKMQEGFAKEEADLNNALLGESVALKKKYTEDLKMAGTNEEKRAAITEQYQRDSADLQYKYSKDTMDKSIKLLEDQLNVEGLSADEQERLRRQLAEARMKLSDMETDHEIENINDLVDKDKEATDERIKKIQYWSQVASDSLNAVNDLAQAIYDAKIQRVEEEQEANEANAEKESSLISELVEKKVITQEEGDARQRALDERKAKKDEELEKKKQKLKERAAIWDKANSLAQAAIATALAITQVYPNVVMAAIIGALGAIQIATIAATPIPKYAKGTDRHPGGPAIVGDGGRHEVVIFDGRAWLTPDTPTPIDLPQGAVVIPSIENIPLDIPNPSIGAPALPSITVNNDNTELCNKIDKLGQKIDGVAQTISRTVSRSIKETAYLADFEKYKNSRI